MPKSEPLKLDSTTLNQLSQDLSNLDRVEDVSASVEPPAPRAAKHNSIFNLEGMDDLFVEDPPR
ncbi:MAG: hypothetical protein HC780_06565 [Leptolyngbyaceae cyanobacterium CSU_1_3]|nr:hypothetical protein [Leptolyngbyaceae cyanobacterium CSU_1_3]